jgi:ABC-type multidrug transport system ATPase subunit/DNA-binding SARP family transcriptional activator
VDFRLLGAVEAWFDQQKVDLGPRKQRFLLAVLALHINQLVPVTRLVDLTWPQSPPATAHHAIHVRVSRLRATLTKGGITDTIEIVTHGSSYALRADPMFVDTHRFRALVQAARDHPDDAEKVTLFRESLALWQGPPLVDVTTPEIVDRLFAGLRETRIIALEDCLDAELRLGRHRMVIDELTELVALHPYRQRLVAQLMLALHRSGRAPEALSAYKAARERLVDEHGIDPEPSLRDLENAILRADPTLDLVPRKASATRVIPVPRQVPGPRTIETVKLTKRYGSRIALDELSFTTQAGEVVGLVGPTGSGKTTALLLLSTLLAPTSGEFSIAGVAGSRPAEIRRRVGMMSAASGYPGQQTGSEYLTYHARLYGLTKPAAGELVGRLLDEVGLTEHAARRISGYSKDLCRRLGLARALVNDPIVVLLDDPAFGLDPQAREQILSIVRDTASVRGATVVLCTHDITEVEQLCSQVLILDKGATMVCGPVGQVTESLTLTSM